MQKFLSRLFARLMKSWSWVLLVVFTVAIKWVSLYPEWVETNYTFRLYPLISKTQRILFGWIPFSIGDLFYGFLVLIILFRTGKFLKYLLQRKLNRQYFIEGLQQAIFFMLFVYVFFNLLWGLNYNRKGISGQLGIQVKKYSLAELDTITTAIQNRLNYYASFVTTAQRDSFNSKKRLFTESSEAYEYAAAQYSFLKYHPASVKPSLFSYLGNYLGFQGYYNPFSGEAQVNTTIPEALKPYVTAHEMAHQLGYGKENEANFVAFLACKLSPSLVMKYSMYFDMYNYAISEMFRRDFLRAKSFMERLHPQVIKDRKAYRDFYKKYRNPVEPIIMRAYSHFLRANNQPAGKDTYNEVVAWLIAYYQKFGLDAI